MLSTSPNVILLNTKDNVCVAAKDLELGKEILPGKKKIRLTANITMGHKIAIDRIASGQQIIKYGEIIGFASSDINPGDWVHTHNVSADMFERGYQFCSNIPEPPQPITDRTFLGYRRANGKVGTRNYIAIISTVNCSASVAKFVAQRFDQSLLKQFPNIDGLVPITHSTGCGIQYQGPGHDMLSRTLAGFANHPNIGGFLLIGLGCEQNTPGYMYEHQQLVQLSGVNPSQSNQSPYLTIQQSGGTQQTVEEATRRLIELLPAANDIRRQTIPASEIILGTECGGSDGNSGITANPALGIASDMLVAAGGTAILAETPEVYGAEQLLIRRARTPQVAEKLIERIRWWESYTALFDTQLDGNPSPGNKLGGLTTIYEKSLGAIAKAGSTALEEVYQYAETVTAKGFVFMDTPGYDPPSVTGMVAGGANVIVFTTGRGSCFGCKPAPSIKIATNTPMYQRMKDDMDINAGVVIDQGKSIQQVGGEIFDEILAVASGKKTKSEQHGIGDEEFVPWMIGPTF